MEPTTAQETNGWTARSIVTLGAIVGVASGMMMAGVEMIYGWISDSHRFWDAPMRSGRGWRDSSTSASPGTTCGRSSSGSAVT
jgi:hypothetical protein